MAYHNENSNIKSMNHSKKLNYLKKLTQILLSVSVFSFFFFQSSLVPILVRSYDYLVSNLDFKFKLFTYTTERNFIFLLCNGILVLIMQSSGLINRITPVRSGSEGARIDNHHGEKDDEIGRFQENKKKGTKKDENLEEKVRESGGDIAAEVDREGDYPSCRIEEWEEKGEEEEDDDDDDDEGIQTDEFNKKCEDFIKKVKQEIQGA